MSKLSPSLKALINAPFARPGPAPAPSRVHQVYQEIAREAKEREFGKRPWLTLSVRIDRTVAMQAELTQSVCRLRLPLR